MKLQYLGHLMWRTDSLEKTLILGKIEGWKGMTEDEMVGWLINLMDMSLNKLQELVMDREVWSAAVHGIANSQIWLTELNRDVFLEISCFFYDPTDVCNLFSGSSAFSKSTLNLWKFLVHVLTDSMDVSLSELREMVMDREAWRGAIHGVTKTRTRLIDWTEPKKEYLVVTINLNDSLFRYYHHCCSD